MRSYMWNLTKEWLRHGAIPADDEKLGLDLGSPGAHIRSNGQLVLESKESMQKRGLASPDDGDALALLHILDHLLFHLRRCGIGDVSGYVP